MFDFLFKKRSPVTGIEASQLQSPQTEQDKEHAEAKLTDKRNELSKAGSFEGQEEAALAFILQSNFSDARLLAARHIHSQQALTKVSQAMRNTDRRVSKLAQERLANLQNQQKNHQDVQACLAHGQELMQRPFLMANQFSVWDKERQNLHEYDSTLQHLKLELEQRLLAQADLQRQVMHIAQELGSMVESSLPVDQLNEQLNSYVRQCQEIQANALAASLPKNLLSQLTLDLVDTQARLQQLAEANRFIAKRSAALQAWEKETHLDLAQVKNEWKQFIGSGLKWCEAQRQQIEQQEQQLTTLLSRATHADQDLHGRKQTASDSAEKNKPAETDVVGLLNSLEQALEAGSLQQALDFDKTLRQFDVHVRGDTAQRLQALRSELNRLLDWAKWGGNVSREELIKVADGLVRGELAPADIAKQVGGLRSRWKELDRTSGAAAQSLWQRFDEACGRAYNIADNYFKQQAQLRFDNLQLAQSQLAEIDQAINAMPDQLFDWKVRDALINKIKLDWRKLGPVDRKLKARLETEFEQKLARLSEPVLAAREAAIQIRLQLIRSVTELKPMERDAVDKVKQAQKNWQQVALSSPIGRKEEQDLWQQFRAACDGVFSQRKANVDEQKQQRQELIAAKEAFCERLESLPDKSSSEIASVLRSAQQQWRELSAQHRGMDARFDTAIQRLEIKLAESQAVARRADLFNLRAKIRLCQQIESADQDGQVLSDAQIAERNAQWQGEWDKLAQPNSVLITPALNKLLLQRFNEAVKNRYLPDQKTAAENLAQFEERLLRVELLRNLPSPVELSQQRLQLQIRDLQSSLKNRDKSENYLSNLVSLCTLPVLLSAGLESRFQHVLEDSLK